MIKDGKTVSKILWAFAGVILIGMVVLQYGCTSQPMPNINIGSAEHCAPSEVNLTIITGNDKALSGDAGNINDDDGGQTPTLGL